MTTKSTRRGAAPDWADPSPRRPARTAGQSDVSWLHDPFGDRSAVAMAALNPGRDLERADSRAARALSVLNPGREVPQAAPAQAPVATHAPRRLGVTTRPKTPVNPYAASDSAVYDDGGAGNLLAGLASGVEARYQADRAEMLARFANLDSPTVQESRALKAAQADLDNERQAALGAIGSAYTAAMANNAQQVTRATASAATSADEMSALYAAAAQGMAADRAAGNASMVGGAQVGGLASVLGEEMRVNQTTQAGLSRQLGDITSQEIATLGAGLAPQQAAQEGAAARASAQAAAAARAQWDAQVAARQSSDRAQLSDSLTRLAEQRSQSLNSIGTTQTEQVFQMSRDRANMLAQRDSDSMAWARELQGTDSEDGTTTTTSLYERMTPRNTTRLRLSPLVSSTDPNAQRAGAVLTAALQASPSLDEAFFYVNNAVKNAPEYGAALSKYAPDWQQWLFTDSELL